MRLLLTMRALSVAALLLTAWTASAAGIEQEIAARANKLAQQKVVEIAGARVAAYRVVPTFFERRGYQPAWFGTPSSAQLIAAITGSVAHGLDPEDFHQSELEALAVRAAQGDEAAVADFEILATDAAAWLLHHLFFGKVDPVSLDADWNFDQPILQGDPAQVLGEFVEAGAFGLLLREITPTHQQYRLMKDALERYRIIDTRGGWPNVPSDTVLRVGDRSASVPFLRRRLEIVGDLSSVATDPEAFDADLESAVIRFQRRHGLEPDGIVGPRSFAALNVPVAERIDQLRASLERARWILRGLGDDFVFVNIAGAETYVFRGGRRVWKTRSITGHAYRKTPVFRDDIQYMEFNPTWTVPNSIFRRDKLSRIRRDPGYLTRNGYTVRNSSGQTLNPSSVNWAANNPSVTLVQRPGPKNALGQVKFMFPNKYAVYLHDTDDRTRFDRSTRNLSSGCVRVEDPFTFADLLMAGDPTWNAARRDAILATGKTTRIDLPKPMPVLLTYFTAWVDGDSVHFRDDVYERDRAVLRALAAPPVSRI